MVGTAYVVTTCAPRPLTLYQSATVSSAQFSTEEAAAAVCSCEYHLYPPLKLYPSI
eukprot:CAMPEP_0197598196 /NCGR_PEP_ID=MMETSP1326-20131121/28833_1 /TAXON_ID=1155430 /ORGANISM="Genus nov. species nov., Strain RCC2288" /LENGTH=55 /DNA_ID=CAMNT_0043164969 /DNA_START=1 /DNA_END=168 /DNA_ORIENTATION=-